MHKYRCYFIDVNDRAIGCRVIEAMTPEGVVEQLSRRSRGPLKVEIWQNATLHRSIEQDNIAPRLGSSGLPERL